MTRRTSGLRLGWVTACAAGLGLALAGGAGAGEPIRGVWTGEKSRWRVEGGKTATLVHLSLRRVRAKGEWNMGESVPLAELSGLFAESLDAVQADVRFDWVRDAGRFALQGRFEAGAGAGHFSFAANPEYVADMKRRGYGEIDDDHALRLALHDVSRGFISELAALGYDRLALDELFKLRIHGASPGFIRGLAGLGYNGLPVEELVRLRIHGATLDFVREMQELGFEGLPVEQLVRFRIHGVTPGFVRAVASRMTARTPA